MTEIPETEERRQSASGLIDLASRALGGCVVYANDELFADRRNLIAPGEPVWTPGTFGPDGKTYDGWETRRRRDEGHDFAIVRLGAAGIVRSLVVDTSFFRGNYPPFASVEALAVEGYPSVAELLGAEWTPLVPRSPLKGDAVNAFEAADGRRWTYVRLSIYPDGGVSRLRVLGSVVPDPRLLSGTVDVMAMQNGGRVLDCSDMFYSAAANLIRPGTAATIAEGWETARRRDGGNDWVLFGLAAATRPRLVELDTTNFTGNASGAALVRGIDARALVSGSRDQAAPDASVSGSRSRDQAARDTAVPGSRSQPALDASLSGVRDQTALDAAVSGVGLSAWHELLPRTRLQPDTVHRFRVPPEPAVTHVRVDVFPDGGMARVRLFGELEPVAHAELATAFLAVLPAAHRDAVLAHGDDLIS